MRPLIFIIVLAAFASTVLAQTANPDLRNELLAMRKVDQEERVKCAAGDIEFQKACLEKLAETVDGPNTRRLEDIFARFGFPDTKMVGKDGLEAFMLLLQHSPSDRLRERAEKPITWAFKRKELPPQEYANFIDRLRLHQGKPQIYGSGFETKDGKLVLSRTRDLNNLDKRRKKIGLPPMSEYIKMLKEFYKLEVQLPPGATT